MPNILYHMSYIYYKFSMLKDLKLLLFPNDDCLGSLVYMVRGVACGFLGGGGVRLDLWFSGKSVC